MGKKWTPERKAAARAKYAAAAKNKNPEQKENEQLEQVAQALNEDPVPTEDRVVVFSAPEDSSDPMSGPQPGQVPDMQNVDVGDLMRRIQELEASNWRALTQMQQPQTGAPQFNPNGGIVGYREKYILDPKRYPNPCERLSNESALRRHAFKENYELEFKVSVSQYQTKDNVNTREPKFTLQLIRIMYDEETGTPTNERYVVCQAIFHEDPEAALVIAEENGVEIKETDEKTFLDEMRYLRMRDWLLEAFLPPKPQQKTRKREMVVGNRVVEVYEINSENSETVPFANLHKKL